MANSGVVGILRALLVAETGEFESKLADATKDVEKFQDSLKNVGTETAGIGDPAQASMNAAADAAKKWWENLDGVGAATAGVGTSTAGAAVEVSAFESGLVTLVGTVAELAAPITAAAVALGAWLAWIYKWTELGPALERAWTGVVSGVESFWSAIQDAWEAGKQFVTTLGEMTTALQSLIPGLNSALSAVGSLRLAFDLWLDNEILKIHALTTGLTVLSGMMGKPLTPAAPGAPDWKAGLKGSALPIPHVTSEQQARIERELAQELAAQQREREKGARTEASAVEKAAKAWESHNQALRDAARSMSVAGVADQMAKLETEVGLAMLQFGGLSQKAIPGVVKQLNEWLAAGLPLPPLLEKIWKENLALSLSLPPVTESISALRKSFEKLNPVTLTYGDDLKALEKDDAAFQKQVRTGTDAIVNRIKAMGQLVTIPPPPHSWLGTFTAGITGGLANLAKDLPNVIIGALQGGGDIGRSVGAAVGADIGKGIGASITKTIAEKTAAGVASGVGTKMLGVLASALGPVGAALGGMLGGVFDKIFDRSKGRDLVVQFADSMGGFDALHARLAKLGDEGERLWVTLTQGVGRNNPAQAQAAIDQVTAAIDRQDTALWGARDKIGGLQSALQAFGGVVPASLRPTIESMLTMAGLPDDIRQSLQNVAQDPSWQTLQSRAEALGVDLAALGPSFQQARLSDIAFGYLHDLQMFADSGANMNAVLKGMSDELSTVYQTAKDTGAKLPDTLKPYMQQLVESGLLLDANGNKVENLDDVFAQIDDTSLKAVVDVLKEIKDLLEKALPKAAQDSAKGVQEAFLAHPLELKYNVTQGEVEQPTIDQPRIGLSGGTHGRFVDWGAGTDVTLHGTERVMTPDELGGGNVNITVVSQLDGREVARNQIKYIPKELVLAGL